MKFTLVDFPHTPNSHQVLNRVTGADVTSQFGKLRVSFLLEAGHATQVTAESADPNGGAVSFPGGIQVKLGYPVIQLEGTPFEEPQQP